MSLIDRIVAEVATRARPLGYKKSGSRLTRVHEDVSVVIWYERHKYYAPAAPEFTVDLEMRILPLLDPMRAALPPGRLASVSNPHWRMRLGRLLPEQKDIWWRVTAETVDDLAQLHVDYFLQVLHPAVESMATSDFIVNEWRNDRSTGLTEAQMCECLSLAEQKGL